MTLIRTVRVVVAVREVGMGGGGRHDVVGAVERTRAFGGALTAFSEDRQQRRPAGGVEELEGVGDGLGAGGAGKEGEFGL